MKGPIAVTGSTGFVGQHVLRALERSGVPLRLLVRQGPRTCGFGSAETFTGDLDDETALAKLLAGAEAVIHLAGVIAAPDRAGFFAVNREGTAKLAQAAVAANVPRFIHVSSIAAREPQLSDYGESKRAGEDVLREIKPRGLLIVRPAVIYGPGDRATLPLLGQLTRRKAFIPGTRESRFSLLFAEDLASFLDARLKDGMQGLCEVDDGQAQGYGWADLVAIAGASEGRAVKPIFLPQWLLESLSWPMSLLGSFLRLRLPLTPGKVRELYHPDWVVRDPPPESRNFVKFTEGFAATVAWYREQGWLPRKTGADKSRTSTGIGEKAK